jgi:hypothetical protein
MKQDVLFKDAQLNKKQQAPENFFRGLLLFRAEYVSIPA